MKTIEESFTSAIERLSQVHSFFATIPTVTAKFKLSSRFPVSVEMIQLFPVVKHDREACTELARAIGGDWQIERQSDWRGKLLGFDVLIHDVEEPVRDFKKVDLGVAA